jgi:hypothetical protein
MACSITMKNLFAISLTIASALWLSPAFADKAFIAIPNVNRPLIIDCRSNEGLKILGPVPSPGGENFPVGNAIAVIIESPSIEPQILIGTADTSEGKLNFIANLEPTSSIVNALVAGDAIKLTRLGRGYIVPQHENGFEINKVAHSCRSPQPAKPIVGQGTFWRQNGSIMQLQANGFGRKFVFYKPTAGLIKAGAEAGTVRFEGQMSLPSKTYAGTAYIFWQKCGKKAFSVTGLVENDDQRVVLVGQAPQFDDNCAKTGESEQKFTFDFIKEPVN